MNDQLAAYGQLSWMALEDSSKQHVIRIVFATRPSTTAVRQLMAKVCPRSSRNGMTNERPCDQESSYPSGYWVSHDNDELGQGAAVSAEGAIKTTRHLLLHNIRKSDTVPSLIKVKPKWCLVCG